MGKHFSEVDIKRIEVRKQQPVITKLHHAHSETYADKL